MVFLPKSLQAVGIPLPVALTRMLTYGKDPGVYAHLSLSSVWPRDSDFIITSIAKCLRDLEDYDGDKSGDILDPSNFDELRPLFTSLLEYSAFEKSYLDPKRILVQKFRGSNDHLTRFGIETVSIPSENDTPDGNLGEDFNSESNPMESNSVPCGRGESSGDAGIETISILDFQALDIGIEISAGGNRPSSNVVLDGSSFKQLPRHLTLQLDNSGKDNKNQFVMAFSSNLVLCGIFETV